MKNDNFYPSGFEDDSSEFVEWRSFLKVCIEEFTQIWNI